MDDQFYVQKQLVVVPFGKRFHAVNSVTGELLFVHRFYKGDWDDEEGWHASFDEWVAALAKVDSAAVPKVVTKGEDEDGIYVVLSRIEGVSLADLVNSGRFGVYAVREFVRRLLEAGSSALREGIIHGAYDPRRIRVGVDGDGKQAFLVEDFGLPFIHQKIQKEVLFMGLPPFASVKQAGGEAQDERGELFSISQLVLYCFAAGHPYSSDGLEGIGAAYGSGHVPNLADLRADLPAEILRWHEQLTGTNGVSGFQSFNAALEALPEVAVEEVVNVDLIAAELTAAQTLTATAAVGVASHPKLITGAVAVKPAEELMAEAGVVIGHEKVSSAESEKRKKTAIMVGGIVAGVLVVGSIIGMMVSGGGDSDDSEAGDDSADEGNSEAELKRMKAKSVPVKGLLYAWNFEGDLAATKGDVNWKALNRERFDEGYRGKAVVLGTNSYYQAVVPNGIFSNSASGATINFWLKAPSMWNGFSSILSTKSWSQRNQLGWIFATESATAEKGLFRWNVSDGKILRYTRRAVVVQPGIWTMVTIVKSGEQKWDLYQDGELLVSYTWDKLGNVELGRILYLGCDSNRKYQFSNDVVLDSLLIWERPLEAAEVRKIHDEELEYFPALED